MVKLRGGTPTKLLFVTLGAVACSKPAPEASAKASPPLTSSASADTPRPNPSADLVMLSTEIATKTADEAQAARDHFRPLCDAEGYPLVGNVAGKFAELQTPPKTTTSAFCAAIRAEQKKKS